MTRALLTGQINQTFLERWDAVATCVTGDANIFDPAVFKKDLLPPLFQRCGIRVEATLQREIYYYLIYAQDDGGGVYCRRIIRPEDGYAYHDVVYADPSGGGNLASNLLSSAIRFYLAAGIREIRLTAGFNVGGLLWPKYGFRPITQEDWQGIHDQIKKNFNKLPDKIKNAVEEDVQTILAAKSTRAIWRFARLNRHRVTINGKEYGAGDRLLHRTRWNGILSMDDRSARAILVARLSSTQGREIETEIFSD